MKTKKAYQSPELAVVEVRCERGYALSQVDLARDFQLIIEGDENREMESFSTHSTWTDDNNNSFWN